MGLAMKSVGPCGATLGQSPDGLGDLAALVYHPGGEVSPGRSVSFRCHGCRG